MGFKKFVTAVILIAMGVGSVVLVKNSTRLKAWVDNISAEGELSGAGDGFLPEEDEGLEDQAREVSLVFPADDMNVEDFPPFPSDIDIPQIVDMPAEETELILPTTIEGGMVIRNGTNYDIDIEALLRAGASQILSKEGVQVLIIHTHGSEAYTADEKNKYIASDEYRTEDKSYSVIRVGDELAACLESYGLNVIHDRESYDYPSYTGSYPRSGQAVEGYLAEHPEIAIVIDLHRDALGGKGVVYKTVAESNGQPSSQIMMLVGTGESGLYHPDWQENLKLALYLQSAVVEKFPSLARPIAVSEFRYNQQLSTGSLILEVGSSGNTLPEALQAIRLFADAVGPALLELVEE